MGESVRNLTDRIHFFKDTDTYKNYVKKQIQDWLAIIQGKKNQEWLIVHGNYTQ